MKKHQETPTTSLAGKRIVLFGGTSGIGFAVAQRAAAEGAQVILASSRGDKVEDATARLEGATGIVVDVKDEQAVATALDRLETFDHVVFTAGDWDGPRRTLLSELDMKDAQRLFSVRFWGLTNVVKHAVKRMPPDGSIVATNGLIAHRPLKGAAMSAAMAGAVESLTRGLAVEVAPIRVNCVCPGAVRTWVWESVPEHKREPHFVQLIARQPLPRAGEPFEVAEAYLYFMRCGYVTGQVLHLDGGATLV